MEGPPFSLTDGDVVSLFSSGFEVELLEKISLEDEKDVGCPVLLQAYSKLRASEIIINIFSITKHGFSFTKAGLNLVETDS